MLIFVSLGHPVIGIIFRLQLLLVVLMELIDATQG
jgi:hypothetical protein